ncbi:MAG: AfsR/SARP family transcriptional regulator, partial [Pseudonocardiaceae bacterium]
MRKLLAVLLVHAGDVVSVDRPGDALWGGEAPIDRSSAVHNLVYRLRVIVRSAGAGDTVRVVTRAPGYVLEVDGADVDSTRFAGLVETARDRLHESPQVAAALLDEALSLWRGPAFAEFADEEPVRAEAARLEELRRAAAADRVDAAIALDRHDEAIGMLEPLRA